MYSTTLLMTGRHDGHMWIQSFGSKRKQTLLVARKVNVHMCRMMEKTMCVKRIDIQHLVMTTMPYIYIQIPAVQWAHTTLLIGTTGGTGGTCPRNREELPHLLIKHVRRCSFITLLPVTVLAMSS